HREQDRIGAARCGRQLSTQRDPRRRPGWLLEARSDPRPRGMAVAEATPDRTRLTGRLAISIRLATRAIARSPQSLLVCTHCLDSAWNSGSLIHRGSLSPWCGHRCEVSDVSSRSTVLPICL